MALLWNIPARIRTQIRYFPPDLKKRVWASIDALENNPEAGKLLEEELAGYRSYRIGRYRLIYRIVQGRLALEAIGPREHIYERFVLEIGRQKIRERDAKYRTKNSKQSCLNAKTCHPRGPAGKPVGLPRKGRIKPLKLGRKWP